MTTITAPHSPDSIVIRMINVIVASLMLVFLAPPTFVTAIVIYATDPSIVLFGHLRVGRD